MAENPRSTAHVQHLDNPSQVISAISARKPMGGAVVTGAKRHARLNRNGMRKRFFHAVIG